MVIAIFFTGVSVGMVACYIMHRIIERKYENKNK